MKFLEILMMSMLLFFCGWLFISKNKKLWKQITECVEACSERNFKFVLFLVSVLPEIFYAFQKVLPLAADEVYTITNAAFFAGYDMSSYMSQKNFYNFGYTMLMAPLYKIFSDPVVIYRSMLIVNALVHAIPVLIAYHILRKFFAQNKITAGAMALVCAGNAINMFFDSFIYNELPLSLVVWLCLLLLLELTEASGKRRVALSALLGFVTAYSYILHSRCLILFVTMAIVLILYLLVYKKFIIQPFSFAAAFTVCILIGIRMVSYVQRELYLNKEGKEMKNSVAYVASKTGKNAVKGWDSIKRIFGHFISLSGALTLELAGVLTLLTVVVLYYVGKNLKRLRTGEETPAKFILTVFSTVSLWGIVGCISLIGANKFYFLLYTRYFVPFLGSFLLLGLILMKTEKNLQFKWCFIWTGVITCLVAVVFIFYTLPIVNKKSMSERTSLFFFLPYPIYKGQGDFSKNVFANVLLILLIFTLILLFLYKRKETVAVCAVVMIFSFILFTQIQDIKCVSTSEKRYRNGDGIYALINTGALDGYDVYCTGSGIFRKSVLLLNYDDGIEYRMSEFKEDPDTVLVTDKQEKLQKYHAPYMYKLDGNEWIGVWSEELSEELEQTYMAIEPANATE